MVWAALGQEPDIQVVQESIFWQLTGKAFDETKGRREDQLRAAFAGKPTLLVLDVRVPQPPLLA